MDHERLTNLVEMAHEAEAFERELGVAAVVHAGGASDARGRGAGAAGRSRRRVRAVGALALLFLFVAGIGLVVGGSRLWSGPTPRPSAKAAPRSGHQDMLIALYRADEPADGAGKPEQCPECWCVQRWKPEWRDVCDVSVVRGDELIDASIRRACVTRPSRVVVIGLSGPAEALPKSDEQARDVALCILDRQGESGPVCVASGVDVRVETWKR